MDRHIKTKLAFQLQALRILNFDELEIDSPDRRRVRVACMQNLIIPFDEYLILE